MRLPGLFENGRKTRFAFLVLNGLGQGGLAICNAWFVTRLFDSMTTKTGFPSPVFVGLGLAIVAGALLRRQERIQAESLGQDYAMAIRSRLFSRLVTSNPRKMQRLRKGSVLLRFVGDLSALRQWVSLGLARLLVAGVSLAVALIALAWLHWPFALGVISVLVAAGLWTTLYSHKIREAVAAARRRQANLAANVSDKIGNLATIQAHGRQRRERRRLRRQSARLIDAALLKAARIGSLRAVMEASAGVAVAVVLALAFLPGSANLTPGNIVAVLAVLGFMAPSLRDIGRAQEYWLASRVARDKLAMLSARMPRLRTRKHAAPLKIDKGAVRFEDVAMDKLINGITKTVSGGSRIAVCGRNGSGKSTLLSLAGRLFDPDHGKILIDGQDLKNVNQDSLRSQVIYVSADLPLLRGSLRKNLTYGTSGRMSDQELVERIDRLGLGKLAKDLPSGFDTPIRNRGMNLSQGQRMRVALLRALLVQPRILLLDEADSYLDEQALEALYAIIRNFEGTVLVATHKPSTMALCDECWIIEGGNLRVVSSWKSGNQQSSDVAERSANIVPLSPR